MTGMISEHNRLVIAASFTADRVVETVEFWAGYLSAPLEPVLAPYGQIYQALLDAHGPLRRNRDGVNALLVRWRDLVGDARTQEAYEAAARELGRAVAAAELTQSLQIVLCPAEGDDHAALADGVLRAELAGQAQMSVFDARDAFRLYDVTEVYDAAADEAGHIPYTDEAMIALGSSVTRWTLAQRRAPVKVIAADCDNTLWGGIVGEDGVDGLHLQEGHLHFQRALKDQAASGRLLCLLSKNTEADVLDVFDQQEDMALSLEDVTAHRINWNEKAENLAGLADELSLGLDSVLFLDDNPVEIAGMRGRLPQVMAIQVPEADRLADFTDHLWLLDQADVTQDDRRRGQMYRENAARNVAQKAAGSLADFIVSLELEITVADIEEATVARFSQLTQRTNQFNAALTRMTEADVRQSRREGAFLCLISARDRFGDYGIVGALRANLRDDALSADVFLLSCRALGRGIEHKMVRVLGSEAEARGARHVAIKWQESPRNQPVTAFLQKLAPSGVDIREARGLQLSAAEAASVRFEPGIAETGMVSEKSAAKESSSAEGTVDVAAYEAIARHLTNAAAIRIAMRPAQIARPELTSPYITPADGLQQKLAAIWEEVLGIDGIGAGDSFTALGGKSLQLVQVHGAIRKLGYDIDLTLLFEHATIADLSARLENGSQAGTATADRAAKMRAARGRRQQRMQRGVSA